MDRFPGDETFLVFSFPQHVVACPDGHAAEPVLERRVIAEFPEILINLDENVLTYVVQFIRIPGKSSSQAEWDEQKASNRSRAFGVALNRW